MFVRYPGSLSCKPFLEGLVTFAINAHFGMSLLHDAHANVERKIEKFMNDYLERESRELSGEYKLVLSRKGIRNLFFLS